MAGYPGTFFTWKDDSAIPQILDVATVDNSPLFAAVFTSDMGPEEFTTTVGKEFFDLYGNNISFAKHGQPLLQAAMQINNGAKLYAKRVVATDATLASSCVYAKVTKNAEVQMTNSDGQPLYWEMTLGTTPKDDGTLPALYVLADGMTLEGDETLENLPIEKRKTTTSATGPDVTIGGVVMSSPQYPAATVTKAAAIEYGKWTASADTAIRTINDAFNAFKAHVQELNATATEGTTYFPLFVFADNGRGVSSKSWAIFPDYEMSKNSKYMVYSLTIKTPSKTDNVYFTFNPNYVIDGTSYCLQQRVTDTTVQMSCKQFDQEMCDFAKAVADAAGTTYDNVINQDVLFGRTRKNAAISADIEYIPVTNTMDSENPDVIVESFSINDAYGNVLQGGSNGSFGDYPINADSYADEVAKVFTTDYPEIYDRENNKFIAIFDANFPDKVKQAIEDVAMFREDFMFFRDFGTRYSTIDNIIKYANGDLGDGAVDVDGNPVDNGAIIIPDTKFVKPYCNYFDVQDPYTKKQITVTMTYLLAIKIIKHVGIGQNLPFCGIRYNITFPEIVPGTMNFIPSVTPKRNEKEEINDARINYCGCYNELYVMETDYTAQKEYTQFSFGCNVMATLAVIRAIRTRCPATRYALATEDGLKAYEKDINDNIIDAYKGWFDKLTFEYVGDQITLANKRYYAAIAVKFTDFIQSEHFTITALPSVSA